MTMLKARPTTYAGVEMRSRTEARFAAFADWAKWPWVYEPRAYGGPGHEQYLPDFVLGQTGMLFAEIKASADPRTMSELVTRMSVIGLSVPDARLVVIVEDLSPQGGSGWGGFSWRADEVGTVPGDDLLWSNDLAYCRCGRVVLVGSQGAHLHRLYHLSGIPDGREHEIGAWINHAPFADPVAR